MTITGCGFKILLVNEGEIVLSDEKTSLCNWLLRVIGCTGYVLLKNFYIDFLLERIGTFKKLRANEVYVHVRVVLTRPVSAFFMQCLPEQIIFASRSCSCSLLTQLESKIQWITVNSDNYRLRMCHIQNTAYISVLRIRHIFPGIPLNYQRSGLGHCPLGTNTGHTSYRNRIQNGYGWLSKVWKNDMFAEKLRKNCHLRPEAEGWVSIFFFFLVFRRKIAKISCLSESPSPLNIPGPPPPQKKEKKLGEEINPPACLNDQRAPKGCHKVGDEGHHARKYGVWSTSFLTRSWACLMIDGEEKSTTLVGRAR